MISVIFIASTSVPSKSTPTSNNSTSAPTTAAGVVAGDRRSTTGPQTQQPQQVQPVQPQQVQPQQQQLPPTSFNSTTTRNKPDGSSSLDKANDTVFSQSNPDSVFIGDPTDTRSSKSKIVAPPTTGKS